MRFELRDMENGVNRSELLREPKGIRVATGFSDDFVGSKISLRELRSGSGGANVLCLDVCRITNVEDWWFNSAPIGCDFVIFLSGSYLLAKEVM